MRRSLVSLVTTAIFCMVMAKSLGIDPVSLCDTFASKSHNLPVKTEFLTSSLKLSEVSATKVTVASSINNPSFATYTKDILVLAPRSQISQEALAFVAKRNIYAGPNSTFSPNQGACFKLVDQKRTNV